jgi:hypothetical protein
MTNQQIDIIIAAASGKGVYSKLKAYPDDSWEYDTNSDLDFAKYEYSLTNPDEQAMPQNMPSLYALFVNGNFIAGCKTRYRLEDLQVLVKGASEIVEYVPKSQQIVEPTTQKTAIIPTDTFIYIKYDYLFAKWRPVNNEELFGRIESLNTVAKLLEQSQSKEESFDALLYGGAIVGCGFETDVTDYNDA